MKLNIAIQGISGSFHDIAARAYFGNEIELIECKTFKEVCETLKYDKCDMAVMAIENSLTGSLLQNYALLGAYNFKIIGEEYVRIQMNLMAYQGVKFSEIQIIQSHPVAIQQCRDFLETLPASVKIIECTDTASAARQIIDKKLKNTAAIAGSQVAEMYGLEIIKERIEDHKKNFTRFIVLSKEGNYSRANNKASISFELGHTVGALFTVLQIFKEQNINMTKIQSLPIMGRPYEYCFHIDIDWVNYDSYEKAMSNILKTVSYLNVLGEYQKGNYDDLPVHTDLKKLKSKKSLQPVEVSQNNMSIPIQSKEHRVNFVASLLKNWNIL